MPVSSTPPPRRTSPTRSSAPTTPRPTRRRSSAMAGRAGLSLGELAATLGATLEGDPGRVVHGVAPLDRAGPDQIAFVADVRYQKAAQMSRAGAFLAPADVSGLPGPVLR